MTCIIGLVDRGIVYMGADSMAANGWNARVTKLPKVFKRDDFLIGYTTSFRMGQLLQHRLVIPARGQEPVMDYMVCSFVESVRGCLKDNGYTKIEHNTEEGGQFLVGYGNRLFVIHSDFQVNEHAEGYDAIGCASSYVLGAMRALADLRPKQRILDSLKIAAHFSSGVQRPFYVKVLKTVED